VAQVGTAKMGDKGEPKEKEAAASVTLHPLEAVNGWTRNRGLRGNWRSQQCHREEMTVSGKEGEYVEVTSLKRIMVAPWGEGWNEGD